PDLRALRDARIRALAAASGTPRAGPFPGRPRPAPAHEPVPARMTHSPLKGLRIFRLVVLACLIVPGPLAGAAPPQRPAPVIEAGAEAAALFTSRGASFARGPRLVVNRDGRNALQFTATFEPLTPAG